MNLEFYGLAIGGATATQGDEQQQNVRITTGAGHITRLLACTILRHGAMLSHDAYINENSVGPGILDVNSGQSNYSITAGDVVTVMVTEKPLT